MPKIAIDPITRIEGHLRVEVQVDNGKVTDAWSCTPTFRGIELILQGRDPREAWAFTQRICGVCTTVNALGSVRAVENALGITIPDNARIFRNLMEGIQYIQDHVIHFYHLHGPDWVDLVNALNATGSGTSNLQKAQSTWPNNSATYFDGVKTKLQNFANSGQLGLFANGYWGHPAYKLPPEGNLMLMAHYLEALEWQKEIIKIHAIIGGKNPHPQTYVVGGMAKPINPTGDSKFALTNGDITTLKNLATSALDFVQRVYVPDVLYIASYYKDWANYGAASGNYLSYGDFPDKNGTQWLPKGIILGKNLNQVLPVDFAKITEDVTRGWYKNTATPLHPSKGVTQPNYTGPKPPYEFLNTDAKYSWGKAPRYEGKVMEAGPLSRMLVAYASGVPRVKELIDSSLAKLGLPQTALFSTLGRVLARALETQAVAEQMASWLNELQTNMNAGNIAVANTTKWNPSTWPSTAAGFGTTEAPRGGLGHWVSISNQKIANYQIIIPSTWNGSPRDAQGNRGAWEQALLATPVFDANQPLEILRTIHSYDPCMACSVHILDTERTEVTQVRIN